MSTRAANRQITDIPRVVEVSFLIPGVGPHKEQYDLGRADQLLAWSLNERLSGAIQTGVRVVKTARAPMWMAKHVFRSRNGMQPYINRKLKDTRSRIDRSASEQAKERGK